MLSLERWPTRAVERGEMIRRLALTLTLLILSPTISKASCSQQQAKDEAGARKFERLWLDALKQSDASALLCFLDENFLDTTWRGQVHTRADLIAGLKDRGNFNQEVEIRKIAIYGDTGIIWGVNLITDRNSHLLMKIAFTDVLRYKDTHWVAVAAEETPDR
jgi:hypothetical protein